MIERIIMGKESENDDSTSHEVMSSKNKRLFYLYGNIDEENCASITYNIIALNLLDSANEKEDKRYERTPIHIYINSYGGSVYDMWSLVDTISASITPVYTYCNGYAMSAAFNIFLAGHKRFVTPHATLMYHQIYCWKSGKYQDLVDDREHLDYLNSQIENYVIERTSLTEKVILSIREHKKDTYFNATQAIEQGIAHACLVR